MPGVVDTTTYKVETLYVTRDEASRGLSEIESRAHGAHSATALLKHTLEAVGLGLGIEKAKHAFIDFNKEVENAKISLSTMLQGNYDVDWKTAQQGASGLYSEFQRFSQLTPVTTQEMLEFGRGVTVATAQAGGRIKDIVNITEQGVVAAKALGMESNYASLELTEMLMGNVSRRMRFAQQILGFAKMDEKEFKKLSAGKRMGVIEKVLNSDAMKNATTAFSTSFSGVVSTLEDKLQILGGKVGLPLFKAVTAEVSSWNEWLDKNQYKVEQMAKTVGETLVTGFRYIKEAASFIYEHASTFIEIGKVWAAVKIGNMASGLLGGAGGMFGGPIGTVLMGSMSAMGEKIAAAVRAGVLSLAIRAPGLIGPMNRFGGMLGGLGGLAGAAGALGPGGILGIGIAAHELGEYLGVHKAITGIIDPMRVKYEQLMESIAKFDSTVQGAVQRLSTLGGGMGTHASGLLSGNIDEARMQRQALERMDMRADNDMNGHEHMLRRKKQLEAAGFAPDDVSRLASNPFAIGEERQRLADREMSLQQRRTTATTATDMGLGWAMQQLSKDQRDAIDVAKATQKIMEKQLQLLGQGKGPMSAADILDMLKNDKDLADPFKAQAKVTQNITNHIQVEVSAKDPDRWMAELDAKASRKVRAPTQAKGSIVGGL